MSPVSPVLCVDVGSTFTKAVLVDRDEGRVLGTAQHPTTLPDVMTGIAAVRDELAAGEAEILACSSAGGGLRLAVVGHEQLVTAEAGRRVALSAGGRVVHLSSGRLTPDGVQALRESRPDLIVLAGGTDGGNADVVVHNARRIGIARLPIPVVLACNRDAAEAAASQLRQRGRTVTVTGNVLPSIGALDPQPAREAIRGAFLEHVIGGKGLSRTSSRLNGRTFRQLVLAPTPDAVLTGLEILAAGRGVLLIDVGGATTDVYSVLPAPAPDDDEVRPETGAGLGAAGDWASARTVEGDLGVRSGALGVVEAGLGERLIDEPAAERLRNHVLARSAGNFVHDHESGGGRAGEVLHDHEVDVELARIAVLVAARRHGRPGGGLAGEGPAGGGVARPLREVGLVIGSGGVLRHSAEREGFAVLNPVLADHGGGWAVPENARLAIDLRYTLFAAGLLAGRAAPEAVARLAAAGLEPAPV